MFTPNEMFTPIGESTTFAEIERMRKKGLIPGYPYKDSFIKPCYLYAGYPRDNLGKKISGSLVQVFITPGKGLDTRYKFIEIPRRIANEVLTHLVCDKNDAYYEAGQKLSGGKVFIKSLREGFDAVLGYKHPLIGERAFSRVFWVGGMVHPDIDVWEDQEQALIEWGN